VPQHDPAETAFGTKDPHGGGLELAVGLNATSIGLQAALLTSIPALLGDLSTSRMSAWATQSQTAEL